ncbi:similar to Saccharomyces cerevisiae YNL284C MRPL10 Mitochondrial ribosomal protein of the large subunit [Maudiozyma barnettii]|uniref:Similar to Saccharomyces cerevisiae YNL284C MRPL10 Mitochondrial ribosomal protein of the large subunit n=1 Tax=Maudiozyma barnettii TaxID=61262 RepID=A0A8H2VDM7_9SACH|nr:mitochondrial 54S ribosomal protein YmL10/YmL18 [Kazachstania barnettii]CAB4253576.1 similar to Saccharomyces cerevisiae YNL284C MRPL10 Mitochondrial ribosomal protein of the large subunit [Kazachstania barnettii]CAD1781250.1 similar to Saccharomyces cerevisiae YNL284C MRPL10 Mitochondrial ribosomal protein of the large subunit [Kazachstania barnettii]
MLLSKIGLKPHFPKFTKHISILGTLQPSSGSTKTFKRLGRGPSSNKGKTSGRGQKGQKARSSVKPWFEGGQTPIYKLFPKLGFKNVHARPLIPINLERIIWFHRKGRLNLDEGEVLTMRKMKDAGVITGSIKNGVKILAKGQFDMEVPLKIEASAASEKAIRAIEKAGGSFVAKYFTDLSLKAHLNPGYFLEKRGRLPLPPRPIKRRDIRFYSDPEKRGYLVVENDPFYQKLQEAKSSGIKNISKNRVKKSELEKQLDKLDPSTTNVVYETKSDILTFDQFEQQTGSQ